MGVTHERRAGASTVALGAVLCLALTACGASSSPSVAQTPTASPTPSPTAQPSPSASPTATPPPPAPAFTTPAPPADGLAWTGLQWHRLAATDALADVGFALRWSGGFMAVARPPTASASTRTPVWFSADGMGWQPLDPGVFGPSTFVVGMVAGSGGLVALSAQADTNTCAPDGDCWTLRGPLQSWTSPDGTHWTPHPGPDLAVPKTTGSLHLVSGPAGLLAVGQGTASTGGSTEVAVSADGASWQTLPSGTLPADVTLNDLSGTSSGYLAVGGRWVDAGHQNAAALWSTDGEHWASGGPLQLAERAGVTLVSSGPSWSAAHVLAGSAGFLVTGGLGGAPGAVLWWQSDDGRQWQALIGYPPLGAWPMQGEGAGGQPYGVLVADGRQIVACRGGSQAAAWTSADGATWTKLTTSGDVPSEQATTATLLPGGVLLSDGTTTWYGQATTH